jgi:hypothetical protein
MAEVGRFFVPKRDGATSEESARNWELKSVQKSQNII